ncbi:putative holin-like toxin [Paenibacillus sp. YN15]
MQLYSDKGGRLISRKGGDAMSVYETLVLMIAFATLVVHIMNKKK